MIEVEVLARDLSLEELPESRPPALSRHQRLLHVRKTPEQAARWEAKMRALQHLLKHRKRMTVDLEKVPLPSDWQNWDAIRAFRIPKAKPSEPGARRTCDLAEKMFDVKPKVKAERASRARDKPRVEMNRKRPRKSNHHMEAGAQNHDSNPVTKARPRAGTTAEDKLESRGTRSTCSSPQGPWR
jgi:hypothetical protein